MPSPYTFRPTKDFVLQIDGKELELRAGKEIPLETACDVIRFVNAARAQTGGSITDSTAEGLAELAVRCAAESGGPSTIDPPQAPPPNPDPSNTGTDTPPPGGAETAETLGAPAAQVDGAVTSQPRAPGTSDGRTLAEQYFDPANPLPDYDLAALLAAAGLPTSATDEAVERVRRNEPPSGARHPQLSKDDAVDPQTLFDPVEVATGAFTLTVVDVTIASVGLPLELRRSYRSGTPHYGPWGFNWDHNYNVFARELDDGAVAVWTGRHHEEVYEPDPAGGFASPTGVFRLMQRRGGLATGYELSEPEGVRLLFDRPPGWPLPERIPLLQIVDRHGNAHQLSYDAAGRLVEVADAAQRRLRFDYDDRDLLRQVTDHTGSRTWRYAIDPEAQDLVSATAPPTTDHPHGTTAQYEYDRYRTHPALQHNMTRVVDALGRPVVDNEYGTDPETDDFGRVVRQEFAGFEATYRATRLQFVPRTPEAVNVPALRVDVVDPGVLHVLTFNYRGDLLDERFRLVRDGSFRLIATTSRYDEQGNLAERREPDGHGYLYEFDHNNPDPRARGNLLRVDEVASPLAPAVGRIPLRATYEPRYQLPKTLQDALGEITEWVWDHESGPGTGRLVELRRPTVTRPDGSTSTTVERFDHNPAGQLKRHRLGSADHVFGYDAAGYLRERRHSGGGSTVVERYERDPVGNVVARVDGVGNRTDYQVNAQNQVERVLNPDGATYSFHYDATGRLVRAEEPRGALPSSVVADQVVVHKFTFDVLGHLVEEVRAANSADPRHFRYERDAEGGLFAAVDPMGRRLVRRLDERGQLLVEELWGRDGRLAYRRRYGYERSGQLRRVELADQPAVHLAHDGFGVLRHVETPDRVRVTYQHDVRGLLTSARVTGPPSPGARVGPLLAERRWDLDERGMPRRLIERLFDDPAGSVTDVITALWLDAEGRAERIEEPNGRILRRTYAATGTLLSERDSLGNAAVWTIDAAGRPTDLTVVEQPTAGGGAVARRWTQAYDGCGRVTTETDPLGNKVGVTYDLRGLPVTARNPNGLTLVQRYDAHNALRTVTVAGNTVEFRRDAADRVVEVLDPTRTVTAFGWDDQDRLVRVRRVDGRVQTRSYDASGALRLLTDFDGSRVHFTNSPTGRPERIDTVPAGVARAAPPMRLSYDGLGRVVRAVAGSLVHTFAYDSLGRLLEDAGPDVIRFDHDPANRWRVLRYPDGRRDRFDYDQLGRLRSVTLLDDGDLDLANQGLAVGTRLAAWEWDGPARTRSALGAAGLTSAFEYDGAARLVGRRNRDAAGGRIDEESSVRDAVGRRRAVWRAAPQPRGEEYRFDDLGRVSRARRGLPGAGVPSSSANLTQGQMDAAATTASAAAATLDTRVEYTPEGTPRTRVDRDGTGTVLEVRTFTANALTQLSTVDGTPVRYDDAGNLTGRGTVDYVYDAFRRLVEVRDSGLVVVTFEYDGVGRQHRRTVAGTPTRLAYAGDEVVQATGPSGVRAQYVPGPSLDQPPLVSVPGRTHLLAYDLVGSLTAVCDLDGRVRERFRYDLFGLPTALAPDGVTVRPNPISGIAPRFAGRPWIAESRLYDFRARAYDPRLFVFLQPDPYPFANGWCHYAFVGYDPLDNVDPFGTFLTVLIGAVVGAAIGGVGAALSGGDIGDVLVGIGAGAVGGAIAGAGNPVLGAAVAGGLMGSWSGGRIGYELGGTEGAVVGALGGGVAGAALGAAGGALGSYVGDLVATNTSALLYRSLVTRGVANASRTVISRYGGQVLGGFAGGTTGGLVTNTTVTVGIDLATDQPVTGAQLWDVTVHSLAVDGPLSAVGAPLHRLSMLSKLPGTRANILGAEGELLVGRKLNLDPANGSERIQVNGRERRPDFSSNETLPRFEAVVEVKNKAALSSRDVAQLRDFATVAANNFAELRVYERPGAGLSAQVTGINNIRFVPIPQSPLVVTLPVAAVQPLVDGTGAPK